MATNADKVFVSFIRAMRIKKQGRMCWSSGLLKLRNEYTPKKLLKVAPNDCINCFPMDN